MNNNQTKYKIFFLKGQKRKKNDFEDALLIEII